MLAWPNGAMCTLQVLHARASALHPLWLIQCSQELLCHTTISARPAEGTRWSSVLRHRASHACSISFAQLLQMLACCTQTCSMECT